MDKTFIKQEIAGIRDQAQAVMLRLDRLQEFIDELTLNAPEQRNEAEKRIQAAVVYCKECDEPNPEYFIECRACGSPLS